MSDGRGQPAAARLTPRPSRVVTVSVVMALALLGDSLLYVVLPLHQAALGLSGFQVGVLLSANRFVRILTNTAASRVMARMAPGPLFSAAAALACLTTVLYALTPQFAMFLLARFAWGLSFSALRLGCFITVLASATERTRGRLMGTYQSISRSGSFVAVMAGGALFDAFGYRAAVLAMAAGTALALPLAVWRGPSASVRRRGKDHEDGDATQSPDPVISTGTPRAARAAPGVDLTEPAAHARDVAYVETPDVAPPVSDRRQRVSNRTRLIAVKWAAFALAFVARGVVTATLALFLRRAFGERFGPGGGLGVATLASWLIGVRWASEIGLAAPLGALSDRIGRGRAALGWLLAATVAVAALAAAPAVGVAVAAASALFVTASGLGATLDAAAGDLAPAHRRAEVMSSYADWTDVGAALGPLLALTFADAVGLRPSYAAGAVLLASGSLAIWFAFRGVERPRAAGPAPGGD